MKTRQRIDPFLLIEPSLNCKYTFLAWNIYFQDIMIHILSEQFGTTRVLVPSEGSTIRTVRSVLQAYLANFGYVNREPNPTVNPSDRKKNRIHPKSGSVSWSGLGHGSKKSLNSFENEYSLF